MSGSESFVGDRGACRSFSFLDVGSNCLQSIGSISAFVDYRHVVEVRDFSSWEKSISEESETRVTVYKDERGIAYMVENINDHSRNILMQYTNLSCAEVTAAKEKVQKMREVTNDHVMSVLEDITDLQSGTDEEGGGDALYTYSVLYSLSEYLCQLQDFFMLFPVESLFPPQRILCFLYSLAQGLAALREAGLAHGNICEQSTVLSMLGDLRLGFPDLLSNGTAENDMICAGKILFFAATKRSFPLPNSEEEKASFDSIEYRYGRCLADLLSRILRCKPRDLKACGVQGDLPNVTPTELLESISVLQYRLFHAPYAANNFVCKHVGRTFLPMWRKAQTLMDSLDAKLEFRKEVKGTSLPKSHVDVAIEGVFVPIISPTANLRFAFANCIAGRPILPDTKTIDYGRALRVVSQYHETPILRDCKGVEVARGESEIVDWVENDSRKCEKEFDENIDSIPSEPDCCENIAEVLVSLPGLGVEIQNDPEACAPKNGFVLLPSPQECGRLRFVQTVQRFYEGVNAPFIFVLNLSSLVQDSIDPGVQECLMTSKSFPNSNTLYIINMDEEKIVSQYSREDLRSIAFHKIESVLNSKLTGNQIICTRIRLSCLTKYVVRQTASEENKKELLHLVNADPSLINDEHLLMAKAEEVWSEGRFRLIDVVLHDYVNTILSEYILDTIVRPRYRHLVKYMKGCQALVGTVSGSTSSFLLKKLNAVHEEGLMTLERAQSSIFDNVSSRLHMHFTSFAESLLSFWKFVCTATEPNAKSQVASVDLRVINIGELAKVVNGRRKMNSREASVFERWQKRNVEASSAATWGLGVANIDAFFLCICLQKKAKVQLSRYLPMVLYKSFKQFIRKTVEWMEAELQNSVYSDYACALNESLASRIDDHASTFMSQLKYDSRDIVRNSAGSVDMTTHVFLVKQEIDVIPTYIILMHESGREQEMSSQLAGYFTSIATLDISDSTPMDEVPSLGSEALNSWCCQLLDKMMEQYVDKATNILEKVEKSFEDEVNMLKIPITTPNTATDEEVIMTVVAARVIIQAMSQFVVGSFGLVANTENYRNPNTNVYLDLWHKMYLRQSERLSSVSSALSLARASIFSAESALPVDGNLQSSMSETRTSFPRPTIFLPTDTTATYNKRRGTIVMKESLRRASLQQGVVHDYDMKVKDPNPKHAVKPLMPDIIRLEHGPQERGPHRQQSRRHTIANLTTQRNENHMELFRQSSHSSSIRRGTIMVIPSSNSIVHEEDEENESMEGGFGFNRSLSIPSCPSPGYRKSGEENMFRATLKSREYSYEYLRNRGFIRDGIDLDPTRLQDYLGDGAFEEKMGVSREVFAAWPQWKQVQAKKAIGLF